MAKAAAAGLLWGVVAVTRPVAGALMLPPIAVLAWTALRRPPRGPLLHALAAASAGALVAPLVVSLVLLHSGLAPLPWSGYRFWMPAQFDSVRGPFMLRSALEDRAGLGEGGAALSNLQLGIRALLGLTGIRRSHQAGFVWPLLGWIAGVFLWRAARRRRPALACASPLATAFLAWTAGHLVVFSLYVYSGGRFYLPVLATLAALFGAGTGVALSRLAPGLRIGLGGTVALLAVFASGIPGPTQSGEYTPPPLERALPRRVPRWLALDDATRARGTVPFDPVFAQALGLLGPEAVAGVHEWGKLPATWHVQQLVKLGVIPAAEMAAPQPRNRERRTAPQRPPL
jgi:hypothetical protein